MSDNGTPTITSFDDDGFTIDPGSFKGRITYYSWGSIMTDQTFTLKEIEAVLRDFHHVPDGPNFKIANEKADAIISALTKPKQEFAEEQVVVTEKGTLQKYYEAIDTGKNYSNCHPLNQAEVGPGFITKEEHEKIVDNMVKHVESHTVPRTEFDKLQGAVERLRSHVSLQHIESESLEQCIRDLKKRNAELETETKAQKDYLDTLYEPYDEADR